MEFLDTFIHPGFWKYRYIVPGLMIIALLLLVVVRRREAPRVQAAISALLIASAVLGGLYFNIGNWERGSYFNAYEFYHYYIGTKYHEELGYSNMYMATAAALEESPRFSAPAQIRDLDNERTVLVAQIPDRVAAAKAAFSPARWAEFKVDIEYFRGQFRSDKLWDGMLRDKGYNASPVWTLVSGGLCNRISTGNWWGMHMLAYLDVLLIAAAFIAIGWAFGHRPMLFAMAFLAVHYVSTSPTLHAAFLRYDWLACLIGALCLVKRGYYGWAGALTAYAACMRVFPAVFVFGIGGRLLWDLAGKRTLNRDSLRFLLVFAGVCAGLVLASLLYTGPGYWAGFAEKIAMHNDDISGRRAGFKYFFLMDHGGAPYWNLSKGDVLAQYHWHLRGVALAALAVAFLCLRRLQDYEAYIFGIIPFFFLSAATYYYFIILVLPFLFFVIKANRPLYALGAAAMILSGAALHALREVYDRSYELFFWLSASVLLSLMLMLLIALPSALRGARAWDAGLNERPEA